MEEDNEYRNKTVINQRGATIEINNSTDREAISISQHSGSNIQLNNLVNSELATNNKQTVVGYDEFETINNDKNVSVGKDLSLRVNENTYSIKGVTAESEIDKLKEWRETYRSVANANSQFKIARGGISLPGDITTPQSGSRIANPVLKGSISSVENLFTGYFGTPIVDAATDEVTDYVPVWDAGETTEASTKPVDLASDLVVACGKDGTNAPGVVELDPAKSAATEQGSWGSNSASANISQTIAGIQSSLNSIEQDIGNGGDEVVFHKRNRIETVGIVNDYPSVRIDPKGRSQPFEIAVGENGAFTNHDAIPHVEEVNNAMNFPSGNFTQYTGNRHNIVVGSGGVNIKTTGPIELVGTTVKIGATKVTINASHGITIGSEESVEIQSAKTISLRTNRQVLVDGNVGIRKNVIIAGGQYIEGELFVQHITAPYEVQQTKETTLYGKFNTTTPNTLLIGTCVIGDTEWPVYALPDDDLILNYDHSHHFANIPLRLMESNKAVRQAAQESNINKHDYQVVAREQIHEEKQPEYIA